MIAYFAQQPGNPVKDRYYPLDLRGLMVYRMSIILNIIGMCYQGGIDE